MYYKITGKGTAVVLLHGFIEEGIMWNYAARALSKKYEVIVPDLEGFGNSPLQSKTLSMEYYAYEIYKLLKKEKVKQCVMLGHSMGGYIALYFAEKYPQMLSGFGLINSHCYADTEEKKTNRKKGNEFIAKHGTKVFVNELYGNLFHEIFKKTNKPLIKMLTTSAEKYSTDALIAANTAMANRKSKEAVLKNSPVPVLLINGKQDEAAPFIYTSKQASLPSIADVHFFENCKHMAVFEKKKETITAMKNFVAYCNAKND